MSDSPGPAAPAPPRALPAGVGTALRVLGWLLLGGLTLACSALLLLGIALASAYPKLPDVHSLVDYRPKLPMRIYSADGVLLGEFGEERRNYVPISRIPQVLQDAVLAIEDARFYQHGGVDYRGALRAALENLREVRSQGASTITMQVARNFYLSSEKTLTRKIYEILLSLKIERLLSKQKILEVYMNQIYLGQRAHGFAAASEVYFGKPLADLSLAEAAMLAGLPKAPSAYNPIVNPKRAVQRQRYILERMAEQGFIDAAQRDAALAQPLQYRAARPVTQPADFVTETVRQLVVGQYGEDAYTRGLQVHLTVRSGDQGVAYRALRRALLDFERRRPYRGPEGHVDLPADAASLDTRVAEALEEYPDHDDLVAAVVTEASPREVAALLRSGEGLRIGPEGLRAVGAALKPQAASSLRIRRGSVVRLQRSPRGSWSVLQLPEVEGAFVSLDPHSGDIRALVGGFDYQLNKFNHVTQAWRQPGSSFKPFVYSAALEHGFSPSTVVNDAPLFFDAGSTGSQPWEPKNYDGQFDGPMSLRRGLAKSKNMVSIRVLQAVGPEVVQQWIPRFGFEPARHPAYLTMALGAGTVTPLQMAQAYAVFANGGWQVRPRLILRITDMHGKVLARAPDAAQAPPQRAIDARNAFVMNSLLQEVTRSGTAARAQSSLRRSDLFGKTGTTNDSIDAWFAGYQGPDPGLVAVVWIGYDQPRKLGDRETGGGLALPVWIDYMGFALRGLPVSEYAVPDGLVQIGGDWRYEEYTQGGGIEALGLDDPPAASAPAAPSPDERRSILDLFRN
ncbi:MAG: penicillin-binding protein 1A [Burkholderiaceae bacterium]|nr:penicillin-binding protein 1A [Burkholderiaceae bacterium]